MLVASNYSMVHGPPIQYYSGYTYNFLDADYSPYFRKPGLYRPPMDFPEELTMPPSPPLSTAQSDSDSSISSLEVLSPPPPPSAISQGIILPNTNNNNHNNNTEVQCKWRSCGIYFPTLDQLAKHVSKVHSASGLGGLFYCGWEGCTRNDKGFNARYKMLVHVRTHTNEKPHMCTLCNKSFSRAENLKIHSRSHSGEKPYICPVPGCNKAYSNSSDRFKHTRTHQVEKPYQCKVPGCPKRYTDPSSLRKHVKTYKHFAQQQQQQQPITESATMTSPQPQQSLIERNADEFVDERLNTTSKLQSSQIYRENVIKHPCDCNRVSCISNCFTKNADLFKITALLNLNDNDESKWNQYIEPYIMPYQIIQNDDMDLDDAPLDLSLHGKNF